MIKAVLDANVLISGLFWKGTCRHIIDLAVTGKIQAVISTEILQEVESVLYEDFFEIPHSKIEEIIRDILSYSYLIVPSDIMIKGLRDLKDTKIIACALSAKADYIVTGDNDLLVLKKYKEIPILSPRSFLDLFVS